MSDIMVIYRDWLDARDLYPNIAHAKARRILAMWALGMRDRMTGKQAADFSYWCGAHNLSMMTEAEAMALLYPSDEPESWRDLAPWLMGAAVFILSIVWATLRMAPTP